MPSKLIDYSKTVIYKIVCNDLAITDIYVGSTTQFTKRKNCHKTLSNSSTKNASYNYKLYKMIRDKGGWLNWSMLQIEEYPCANGNEARTRERYWYEQLQATLNTVVPVISTEEKKEYHKTYNKEWIDANKEKIKEGRKIYLEKNKEIIKIKNMQYALDHKEEKKEYREINKEKLKLKAIQYREINKDIIKKKKQEYYIKNKAKKNIMV